jgi:tetratricopeptide (TPR) repeat protein
MEGFIDSYRRLIAKLKKKKIFRKPVYGDSIDEFAQLLTTIKRTGGHQYVAFCNLAVARAEQSLKNYNKEASNYVEAGTVFWDLEQQERTSMAVAGFEDYATEAINCYLLAIKIQIEQKRHSLACTLYCEMAQFLKSLNKLLEATEYFKKAAELQEKESPINALSMFEEALHCNIIQRDYLSACDLLTAMIQLATRTLATKDAHAKAAGEAHSCSVYINTIVTSRLTQILLYVVQREFDKANSILELLIEFCCANGINASTDGEVFSVVRDVISACDSRDTLCLDQLCEELWAFLTPAQHEVYLQILQQIKYDFALKRS